jgi:hypothetical protein
MIGPKSVVFILVIAAAIAVAAWSLVKANRKAEDVKAQVGRAKTVTQPTLAYIAPDKDFAFVLLAGADSQETITATRTMEQACATLGKSGVRAVALAFRQNDADFKRLVSTLGVAKLPAVILFGKDRGPTAMTGEITEDALLRSYVVAACASGCEPGACGAGAATSGCCPGQ